MKMPVLSLLDIEPDKLFENRNVSEVEEIQKIVNNEIEKKKEDLRTLVGERYRDLIEAADTIKEMKELSGQIINDVDRMNSEMFSLQKNHRSYNPDAQFKEREPNIFDSIAAQISVLTELPELIWTAISNKDYVRATHLYLLGRHIKTGFTVDKNLLEYSSMLPVVDQQWLNLSKFFNGILSVVENDLKQIHLPDEEASMCLASIAILQETSLITKFLSLRTEAVNSLLFCDNNVKKRILDSCTCIINSLSLLNASLIVPWEAGRGLTWKLLHKTTNNHHPVNLLEDNIKLRFLPPIVTHFKVIPLSKNDSINMKNLEKEITEWLDTIKNIVSNKGKVLLNNVNSLHVLNTITSEYKKSDFEWEQLLATFNIKNKFDVWDGIYKPLITARAKELISLQCDETFKDVVQQIEKSISEDFCKSDLDLRWFVWKEEADDIEINSNKSDALKGICLKSKAITPKVLRICNAFEQKLSSLYQDLSGLYSSEDILDTDSNELKNHQQTVCSIMIERLIKHIHDVVGQDGLSDGNVCILARFLQAVPDICPMLQKCLMLGENKENAWQTIKLLNVESLFCWSIWEMKALKQIETYIPRYLKVPTTYADLLSIIPQWDSIWIEEGDEMDGNKSQLRVPSAPSLPLQSLLQHLMTEVGRAHIPRLISENLMQKVVPILLNYLTSSQPLCQVHSLQCLFDIKYVSAQFIPLTNKELSSLCQEKICKIESNIDPIDLEAFSPLIRVNVKSAVIKTQGMFGLAFRSEDSAGVKMSDDACILALSKSTVNLWFPTISLTNPSNRLLHTAKSKAIKVDKQMMGLESSKTQSSSSFFSDWFS